MDARARYVSQVLERYASLPGTLRRVLAADRLLAGEIYDRSVPLHLTEDAFLLAVARRTFSSQTLPIEPIRSLRYFLPVIDELLRAPPPPGYLASLRAKLIAAGAWVHQVHHQPPPALGHASHRPTQPLQSGNAPIPFGEKP